MIPKETIETIKRETCMVSYIGEEIRLNRRGDSWWGLCPFHEEKTPSFTVSESKRRFKCWGCGRGGDIIRFVMDFNRIGFHEATVLLANYSSVPIYDSKNDIHYNKSFWKKKGELLDIYREAEGFFKYCLWQTPKGQEALSYLRSRGLSDKTLKSFDIGYAPLERDALYLYLARNTQCSPQTFEDSGLFSQKFPEISLFLGRIMFPIRDCRSKFGSTIAFIGRTIPNKNNPSKIPKYINSPETTLYKKKDHLFGLVQAEKKIKEDGFLLCEGPMDVLALHELGYTPAIASLGTGVTVEQIQLLIEYSEKGAVFFDNDEAGERAKLNVIYLCTQKNFQVRIVEHKPEKDPAEALEKGNIEGLKESLSQAREPIDVIIDKAHDKSLIGAFQNLKICEKVFPFISISRVPLVREALLRHLASRINVEVQMVVEEYKLFMNKTKTPSPNTKELLIQKPKVKEFSLMYKMFGVFFNNPGIYKNYVFSMRESWLKTKENKLVFQYLDNQGDEDFLEWLDTQTELTGDTKESLLEGFHFDGSEEQIHALIKYIITTLNLHRLKEKEKKFLKFAEELDSSSPQTAHAIQEVFGEAALIQKEKKELQKEIEEYEKSSIWDDKKSEKFFRVTWEKRRFNDKIAVNGIKN